MNRYWNAKIETKLAKIKNADEKEKRLFQIKINGINDQNSPFKIKTQRNDDLFSKEFFDYFKSTISSANLDEANSDQLDQYIKCAYHGRNKRISLYVIGCEHYNGLLILDENLYSLIPVQTLSISKQQNYRIELISSTVKYNCTTDEGILLKKSESIFSLHNAVSNSFKQIDVVLNLEKRYFNDHLFKSNDLLSSYLQNLIFKCHLIWSYYYYEHDIQIQFKRLSIDYFTASDYVPRKQTTSSRKLKLFNLDPEVLINTNTQLKLKNIYQSLSAKFQESEKNNEINLYSVPSTYLDEPELLDGIASQSSFSFDCPSTNKASLVLAREKVYNETKDQKFRLFKTTLEEANIMIDLIGYNLGNRHKLNNIHNCNAIDEYNWYFQVHTIQEIHQDTSPKTAYSTEDGEEYDTSQVNICLNRLIKINPPCSGDAKSEISVVKESICGNGIVESNEQCDCGVGADINLKCLNCCDMKTCKFTSKEHECAAGDCCDFNVCKFKSKSTVCRHAIGNTNQTSLHSTCDWAEFCDGNSSKCPEDRFHHNGVECKEKNEPGICWQGQCVSSNLQCQQFWSDRSKNSDKSCYSNFNTIGFENGNCGVSLNESNKKIYKSCETADVECGLLQCQLGSEQPLIKSESYFKATTSMKGQNYECKSITSQPSIYASDGTKCTSKEATNKTSICVKQKCVYLEDIIQNSSNKCINPTSKSGLLCSNNGVCDNKQKCSCFDNWSGKHCDQFIETSFLTKNSLIEPKELKPIGFKLSNLKATSLISLIAGVSIVLIVLVLISYLICRRFRTRKIKQKKNTIKKSLSRSLIEFDNDYNVNSETTNSKMNASNKSKSIFSSFRKTPELTTAPSTSTRANSIMSLNMSQPNLNSFVNQPDQNDCSISLTKVNHAIQQLNTQPAKSILKKVSDSLIGPSELSVVPAHNVSNRYTDQNVSNLTEDSNPIDSSLKFERQVNRNTILNSAIGNGHRSSRRSLVYDNKKRASICSVSSNSSSSSSISLSSSSSESISSSLSKSNKQPKKQDTTNDKTKQCSNLSLDSNASSSISSVILQEPTKPTQNQISKTDFLKVQDYLNELNILSKQNAFADKPESNRCSKIDIPEGIQVKEMLPDTSMKQISLILSNYQNKLAGPAKLEEKLVSEQTTPRPNSLLTTVYVAGCNKNADDICQTTVSPSSAIIQLPTTQMLHLQISKQPISNYDENSNLFTNSSETSSGYMSNSTTNLNHQQFILKTNMSSKGQTNALNKTKEHLNSRESLFETDEYYSTAQQRMCTNHARKIDSNDSSSSSRSSTALTPTPPLVTKVYLPVSNNPVVDKRISYYLATASSNNIDIS